jgi:hypothetical protein
VGGLSPTHLLGEDSVFQFLPALQTSFEKLFFGHNHGILPT